MATSQDALCIERKGEGWDRKSNPMLLHCRQRPGGGGMGYRSNTILLRPPILRTNVDWRIVDISTLPSAATSRLSQELKNSAQLCSSHPSTIPGVCPRQCRHRITYGVVDQQSTKQQAYAMLIIHRLPLRPNTIKGGFPYGFTRHLIM